MQTNKERITHSIAVEKPNSPGTKTFNESWALMKGIVLVFGVVCVLVVLGSVYMVVESIDMAQKRAFIITNQGTFIANEAHGDLKARRVEVENHIKLFLSKMYAFDERTYKSNIEDGLNLIGDDGKLILSGYENENMLTELVKTNGNLRVSIDSIYVDMDQYPYRAVAFAKQTYETRVDRVDTYLWMNMYLRNVQRSRQNVHGLLIDDLQRIKGGVVETRR